MCLGVNLMNKSFSFIILALFIFHAFNCKDQSKIANKDGRNFLYQNCNVCHNPDVPAKVAPGLQEIKEVYLKKNQDEISFTNSILDYIVNPNVEHSKNPTWIESYGIMPKMSYDENRLKQGIAELYRVDLGSKDWKEGYMVFLNSGGITSDSPKDFMELGRDIAMQSKAELGKNLMNAIKTQGTEGAVTYCNTRAIPLTEEMSSKFGMTLKRVSDKPRNQQNIANAEELKYINVFKNQIEKKEKLTPIIKDTDLGQVGYYPIETNAMCLQCHGESGKDIKPEVSQKIANLYPKDRAIGYGENQIRGMWVVEKINK